MEKFHGGYFNKGRDVTHKHNKVDTKEQIN